MKYTYLQIFIGFQSSKSSNSYFFEPASPQHFRKLNLVPLPPSESRKYATAWSTKKDPNLLKKVQIIFFVSLR